MKKPIDDKRDLDIFSVFIIGVIIGVIFYFGQVHADELRDLENAQSGLVIEEYDADTKLYEELLQESTILANPKELLTDSEYSDDLEQKKIEDQSEDLLNQKYEKSIIAEEKLIEEDLLHESQNSLLEPIDEVPAFVPINADLDVPKTKGPSENILPKKTDQDLPIKTGRGEFISEGAIDQVKLKPLKVVDNKTPGKGQKNPLVAKRRSKKSTKIIDKDATISGSGPLFLKDN